MSNIEQKWFLGFKNFLENFGHLSQFCEILMNFANFGPYRLQNFGKSLVTLVTSYWDQIWKILIFEFYQNRKVMINHRGGILILCQIFDFCENRKFEILNPSSNPNFGSLTLNPNSRF